ncbi:MAG TPA: hypothetical protein VK509_09480 [Polyangiales bacterium]|nr:hypothetical protein [Polyangiales bacterium]
MRLRDAILAGLERAADAFLHRSLVDERHPSWENGGSFFAPAQAALRTREREQADRSVRLAERSLDALLEMRTELDRERKLRIEAEDRARELAEGLDAACDKLDEYEAGSDFGAQVHRLLVDVGEMPGPYYAETQLAFLERQLRELKAAREGLEVLRVCVREDIVIVEAPAVLSRYDAWTQSTTQTNGGGHG